MKHSAWLFVVLVMSTLLVVACGGGGGDTNSYDGTGNESQIKTVILKTAANVDHTEGQLFNTAVGKVNLPANSVGSNYDIEITKIDTGNLSNYDKSLLKSRLRLDSKSEFMSPVLGINVKYSKAYDIRASINIEGNGVQLYTVSSITINLDTYVFDWDKWYYYVAFRPNDNSGWSFTPLKKENFQGKTNQLVINTNKLSKNYVILRMPNPASSGVIPEVDTDTNTQTSTDTSTDTCLITGISLLAEPSELIASQTTGKFAEDMKVSVGLEYTGSNPFAYTTPTIEFLAFKSFDLGNSVKANYENGVYSYTYNRFTTPESDFANQASFTLTLPTKGVSYDADKFPENIFVTAKFKAKDNKDYQTSPTSIAFKYDEPKKDDPRTATPTVVLYYLYNYAQPSQLTVTESETSFKENIVIDGGFVYEDATPTLELTPLYVEFTSASAFDLGNSIVSAFADDVYTYRYEVPADDVIFNYSEKTASFSITLPLKGIDYNAGKHPAVLFVKSKYDKYESNQIAIKFINEAAGNISVVTTFPGSGNIINGKGSVTLDTTWSGGSAPYTVKYICNNQLLSQETVLDKNTAKAQITGDSIGGSNGSVRFVRVRVAGSDGSNLETVSDGIVVDTQKPVLVATITNDTVFGTKDVVKIEVSSNETVYAPSVISENVAAVVEEEQATGTKFIYRLQLNDSFTTGVHNVTIVASDTSEPMATANCSTIIATFSVDTSITYPFAQGAGTEDNPFLIETVEDFNRVNQYPNYCYKQINDLDFSSNWNGPIHNFSRIYDGNEHIIINANINAPTDDCVGLFSVLNEGAVIKNITVENASFKGKDYVGIIVGYANVNSIIDNCHVAGVSSGTNFIGGIAGSANNIINCSSSATVTGLKNVGGITGESGYINNCEVTGNVNGLIKAENVGGIVGSCFTNSVTNCNVTISEVSGKDNVGGIVGWGMNNSVVNCNSNINHMSLIAIENWGNLDPVVGYNEEHEYCPENIGGIQGKAAGNNIIISNCKRNGRMSFSSCYFAKNVGGILGCNQCNNAVLEKNYSNTLFFYQPHKNNTLPIVYRFAGAIGSCEGSSVTISNSISIVDLQHYGGYDIGGTRGVGLCVNRGSGSISVNNCIAFTKSNSWGISYGPLVTIKNSLALTSSGNPEFGVAKGYSSLEIKNVFVAADSRDSDPDTYFRVAEISDKTILDNNFGWIMGTRFYETSISHGENVAKSDFWGASTQSTFWANPDKLGWDFDNVWEFRAGYNLPQLRGMPAIEDPDYIN